MTTLINKKNNNICTFGPLIYNSNNNSYSKDNNSDNILVGLIKKS